MWSCLINIPTSHPRLDSWTRSSTQILTSCKFVFLWTSPPRFFGSIWSYLFFALWGGMYGLFGIGLFKVQENSLYLFLGISTLPTTTTTTTTTTITPLAHYTTPPNPLSRVPMIPFTLISTGFFCAWMSQLYRKRLNVMTLCTDTISILKMPHRSGSVCLDVINQTWSPMFGMFAPS